MLYGYEMIYFGDHGHKFKVSGLSLPYLIYQYVDFNLTCTQTMMF